MTIFYPKMVCLLAILSIALVAGCSKRDIEARYPFPSSPASIVVERQGFGGGAGSLYQYVYIISGKKREEIVSSRTSHQIKIDINRSKVIVEICRGTAFNAEKTSVLPYGTKHPVEIEVNLVKSCDDKLTY